ncbi:hypothetical protein Q5752_004580 [Cryptotrichosporon argae]
MTAITVPGYTSAELEQIAEALWKPHLGRLIPFMVGLIFDGILQGIVFCQFARWWDRSFSTESIVNRLLAFWMLLISVTFTAVQGARVVEYFCYGFGQYIEFLEQRWGMAGILLLLLALVPSQGFYIHRAYMLSNRSWPLTAFLCIMWAATISLGVAALVNFPAVALEWMPVQIALFTSLSTVVAATDVSITLAIVACLWRRRTGEDSSDRLVSRLVRLSAETQLPPSIFAILFAGLDTTGHLWVSPALVPVMMKSCIMALFKVLDSRRKLRKEFLPRTLPPPTHPQALPTSMFMRHSQTELEIIHTPGTPPPMSVFVPTLLDGIDDALGGFDKGGDASGAAGTSDGGQSRAATPNVPDDGGWHMRV